jgi:ABC-2 type transport system permease protein
VRSARIAAALIRLSLMTAMQYRSDFAFELLTGALRTFGAVAPLFLVYEHADAIAGWSVDESMVVMAFFLLLGAFHGGVMEPNLGAVVESIRQGQLDLWLVKPVDAQLLVSMRRVDPAYLWDLAAAVAVGAWAMHRLPAPAVADVAVAAALLPCGLAAMYGLWIFALCTAFYFVRVDNLRYLLVSVADAGRWPRQVFAGAVRFGLTFVVPVALVTSLPAEALRGAWTASGALASAITAAAFVVGSRVAWQRSLAAYTSSGS